MYPAFSSEFCVPLPVTFWVLDFGSELVRTVLIGPDMDEIYRTVGNPQSDFRIEA